MLWAILAIVVALVLGTVLGAVIMWRVAFREGGFMTRLMENHQIHTVNGMKHAYAHVLERVRSGDDAQAIREYADREVTRLQQSQTQMVATVSQGFAEEIVE